jgi:hypothetical protein
LAEGENFGEGGDEKLINFFRWPNIYTAQNSKKEVIVLVPDGSLNNIIFFQVIVDGSTQTDHVVILDSAPGVSVGVATDDIESLVGMVNDHTYSKLCFKDKVDIPNQNL